jgi:hypothetical protein
MLKLFRPTLLLLTFLVCTGHLFAQNDVLVFRKGNKRIKTFMTGSNITFQLTNYQWIQGDITAIRNDSFFVKQYILRQSYAWGAATLDTAYMNIAGFSLQDVLKLPRKPAGLLSNGSLLMIGGGGYTVLNVVNTLGQKEPVFGKENRGRLLSGVGTFMAGLLLNIFQPRDYVMGGKYQLHYIHIHADTPEK